MISAVVALVLASPWLVQDSAALSSLESRKVQHNIGSDSPASSLLVNETSSAEESPAQQVKVWIDAFGRSGSSTLLSMVEAVALGEEGKEVFSLFEPTHDWQEGTILGDLAQLFSCNTTDLPPLWGLWDPHTMVEGPRDPEGLEMACRQADVVAIKTINAGHDLQREVLPMLEQDPDLKVLYLVRDPRAILASQQTTQGDFSDDTIVAMLEVCHLFHRSGELQHPRVKQVVFEEMVAYPHETAASIYQFLGLPPPGPPQTEWINANFNGTCGGESLWMQTVDWVVWMFGGSPSNPQQRQQERQAYSDCRPDASPAQDGWRHTLSPLALKAFNSYHACRAAAAHYRWPTGITMPEPYPSHTQHDRLYYWLVVLVYLVVISLAAMAVCHWCTSKDG